MKAIIDRFEEEFAVCEMEGGQMKNILRSKLPKETEEGMVLNIAADKISIDWEETNKLKKETEELMKDLWE